MAIKDSLLPEFDHEVGTTRKLLERVPDAQLGWKPHEKSMTLGQLASHLSNIPNWGSVILDQNGFDMGEAPSPPPVFSSRADIVAAFDDTTRKTRASLAERADPEFAAMWTLSRGGQQMFSIPRAGAFRSWVMNHMIHHRGQLAVYLRLLDVPVPSIYGPSADEQ